MSGGKSAFLDPGGYATHEGGLDDARGRLRTLTRLFLRAHWRGTRLRLFLTSFLMTPAIVAIVAMARTSFDSFAVPVSERSDYMIAGLAWVPPAAWIIAWMHNVPMRRSK